MFKCLKLRSFYSHPSFKHRRQLVRIECTVAMLQFTTHVEQSSAMITVTYILKRSPKDVEGDRL